MKEKEPVRLRQRKMPSGRTSLYLDIYIKGNRTYEYLHLYLIDGKSRDIKEKNRQTMVLAEAIRAKRLVEVRNGEYGFRQRNDLPLFKYIGRVTESKHGSTKRRYDALLVLLRGFERRTSMMVGEITPAWFTAFSDYINRQKFAPNTKSVYIATLRWCINQAHREGLLPVNPIAAIKGVGWEETNRTYLTADDVRTLAVTPCDNDITKRAFLFGCLTGLRHCDIRSLTWGDVTQQGGYTRIIFRQSKTHGQEYLDINPQAASLMGENGKGNQLVFPLPHESYVRRRLAQWAKAAGITKHVTFHTSRHTFAVMMLEIGTDIYTVSKLLGHRDIATTQIYARVLDKAKQEAVSRIPNLIETEKRK